MEYNEFYEDESEKGGRRYKKDPTKRTLNLGIFNGAYLMDRIVNLFKSDQLSNDDVLAAHMYKMEKDKGRVGINVSTMSQRRKLMSADIVELLTKSYSILHDPRKNGNKMEFDYSIKSKLFVCKFRIQIDYVDKMILLVNGEFYSECFPSPLDSESELLDERNTFFEVSDNKSVANFSSTLMGLIAQSSGGERVETYKNEQLQIEISELVVKFMGRMFKEQLKFCDKVDLTFRRKRKPFKKLDESVNRILELFKLID